MLKVMMDRSNRNWNRSQRRRYFAETDIDIQFDWNQPLDQSCSEILRHITTKNVPKNQILAYLNLFIKYCLYRYGKLEAADLSLLVNDRQRSDQKDGGSGSGCSPTTTVRPLDDKEILCCLRIPLFHEGPEVRASTLRAIRYLVQSKHALAALLSLNMHHLIARSLDLVLENRLERLQAMRLIRHIMAVEHTLFPVALGRCLCSVSNDHLLEMDMLLGVCWATIAELTIVNAAVSARSGCINVLVRCALNSITGLHSVSENEDFHGKNRSSYGILQMTNLTIPGSNISIAEAILSSFLHLYNYPETRRLLLPNGYDLFYFVSPFTDLYSFYHASKAARDQKKMHEFNLADHLGGRHNDDPKTNKQPPFAIRPLNKLELPLQQQPQQAVANSEQRTLRYLACKNALLSVMRSWPGMFFMCRVQTANRCGSLPERTQPDDLWSYENLCQQVDPERVLRDSLKVFGYTERAMPKNLTQMLKRIGKALNTDCDSSLSFFPSAGLAKLNPLESLVSILHLPYDEIQRHLLEMLYELFGIKSPEWSDDFEVALKSIYFNYPLKTKSNKLFQDCSTETATGAKTAPATKHFPDEWELYDGFVANEAEEILPNLSFGRLNFVTNYHALLLQSLIDFGLLEALISVILNSHDRAAINLATILTGELLYMSGKYLPPSAYAHRCQSLPLLVAASISGCRERRNRALMTISHLNRIHEIRKLGPRPASFFLQQQIYFCRTKPEPADLIPTVKPRSASISKAQDENVIACIKSSGILRKSSFRDWDWDVIAFILKSSCKVLRKLEEKEVRYFIGRLTEFFTPSKQQFSCISKNSGNGLPTQASPSVSGRYEVFYCDNPRLICAAAIHFIDFLLTVDETKSTEYLQPFVQDLERCLKNVATKGIKADEILIPSRFQSTLSRHYFVLLGRFTHFKTGRKWLEITNIYQYLLELTNLASNDVYTKLIVSSLDYAQAGFPRNILAKVLTSRNESSRLYATKFLRVLLRAAMADFSEWGVDCLIPQLYDQSLLVCLEALDILDEACSENPLYLEKVLQHRPPLLNLGDNGIVFFTRLASYPPGITALLEQNMLQNELERWQSHFCLRYVRLVEDSLNECFSCHQKGSDKKYGRRSERQHFPHLKGVRMISYLAHHLYGQLVKTYQGMQIVIQHSIFGQVVQTIESQFHRYMPVADDGDRTEPDRPNELDVLRLKAALWSMGHLASSEYGFEYLMKCHEPVLAWIILLVERSVVLSIRATGFYAICLIASTQSGFQVLSRYGWTAVQHSHRETFPIDEEEFENFHRPNKLDSDYLTLPQPNSAYSSLLAAADEMNNASNGGGGQSKSSVSEPKQQPHQAYQLSITSSNSSCSSSSYVSIISPSTKPMVEKSNHHGWSNHLASDKSFALSSSTASIFSNTSSIGSLTVSSIHAAAPSVVCDAANDNRTRSSSECAAATSRSVGSNLKLTVDQDKTEYQDSGIMDPSSSVSMAKSVSPNRNRKISAPCFQVSQPLSNREARSDSNDSAQTNHTASRSTSFTEYSTTSSVTADHKNGVSMMSPEMRLVAMSAAVDLRPIDQVASLLDQIKVTMRDDPYPSSVDAYGYTLLRAIQKIRVQSLSGTAIRNGLLTCSPSHHRHHPEPDSYSSKSCFACQFDNNGRNIEVPDLTITDDFPPPQAMFFKERSVSGFSRISAQSEDPLELETMAQNKFMCLCLPQSLSLIFHLDETPQTSSNKKRVTFPNESQQRFKTPKLVGLHFPHISSKCLRCCFLAKRSQIDDTLTETNNLSESGGYAEAATDEQDSSPTDSANVENIKPTTVTGDHVRQLQLRQDALRLVSNLGAATTHAKQAEQGLLSLKQKHPPLFEDFCLYSDVCVQMEKNHFRSTIRRFLHELFLDINLSPFYQDAKAILNHRDNITS